ncbi:hemagglutinin [Bifidobacterium avesanii]|nr:hemagglutinin [Bifidobacterium avesanii]
MSNRNKRGARPTKRRDGIVSLRAADFLHWQRSWGRAGLAKRVAMAGTTMVAAVMVVALVLAMVRVVQYQRLVASTREQQREYTVQYDFDPGDIISDAQFFNADAMSADDVQAFLDDKGAKCSGDQCLKSKTFDVDARDADDLCGAVAAAAGRIAAQVIDTAARACGISQKVLLTLMQKEQHLVTAAPPSDWNYQAAMGLSCPDDASCDPQYAGFVNQVIGSARRFRYYLANEKRYKFRTGKVNAIQYHPNVVCGTGNVFIENDATTLLYIYTPYQPNAAALAAGTGTGDACSSYGNRNFAIIYSSWFGDPRA